jgi:hypothetical protein
MGVPFAKLEAATERMAFDLQIVEEIFEAEPRDMSRDSRDRLRIIWHRLGDLLIREVAEHD